MGILDGITNTFNKGAAAAERGAKTVKLKAQVAEVNKKRQQLAAQLGASLYEATKEDESLRQGREALYDGIKACDTERDECLKMISEIEEQAALEAAASNTYKCTVCGSTVGASDLFCSGCGTSADQIRAQSAVSVQVTTNTADRVFCSSCGFPMSASDSFCIECGAKVGGTQAAAETDKTDEDDETSSDKSPSNESTSISK